MIKPVFLAAFISLSLSFESQAQEGKWEEVQTANTAPNCNECGMAAVNGKLYLFGGDNEVAKPVLCFDPATNRWTKLAAAPVPMHHFEAVALQKEVFVLEAFSGGDFPNQDNMPNVYSYDTEKDTWEKGGEVPPERRRAGAGAVAYQGKLYLVAGIRHGHASGTTDMFDCYDPQTKAWTILPNAPHIRDHCSATVIGDKLYLVGGRNTSFRDPEKKVPFFAMTLADVDVYDFKSGRWSTLDVKLPQGSGGGAVVNLGGTLYYMGGERATLTERNAPRKNVYSFDPATQDLWKETASLNQARNGMAAAVIGNTIYVAGGSGGPGGPPPGGAGPGGPGSTPPTDMAMPPMNPPPPRPHGPGEDKPLDLEKFVGN